MAFKDSNPYLQWVGKIDPVSEIRNAGIITSGNVYWVKDPSDNDYISFKDAVGRANLFDTIAAAVTKCTDDQNDYIMVCPKKDNGAWELTAALDINKARVHLISVGYTAATHGYSNTIQGFAGATYMDDELIHVTNENVEIAGFRLLGTAGTGAAGTFDNALLYLSGSAHNLWVHDCEIENIGGDWADDVPASLVGAAASQHGARFDNCMIGGTIPEATGTQVPVIHSASGQNWEFHNVKFLMDAGHASQEFAEIGTGKIGYTLFDNCQFINVDQANAPASALTGNLTDDQGVVLMHYCTAVNVTAFGTDDNMWVAPSTPGTAGAGLHNPGLGIIGTAGSVTA